MRIQFNKLKAIFKLKKKQGPFLKIKEIIIPQGTNSS